MQSSLVVYLFAVDSSTRGSGVGAKLLEKAKRYAAATPAQEGDVPSGVARAGGNGIPLALHATLPAVGFYKRQGFKEVGLIDLEKMNQQFLGMIWQDGLEEASV